MNIQFGTGVLYMLPNAGNLTTDPTPFEIAALQNAQVDFKSTLKKMFGQEQFPLAHARGQIEVSCKAKAKTFDPNFIAQLYFGQTPTVGQTYVAVDEADTVGASTPFQVTVANSSAFVTNYGVKYAATGEQLIEVASSPAQGEYSVSAGVYTFASADASAAVLISYTYTSTTANTTKLTITNQLMGYAPEFRALLTNVFRGKRFTIELNDCTMGGLSIPTKQDDFWEMDVDFEACCDASGTLGSIYADNF